MVHHLSEAARRLKIKDAITRLNNHVNLRRSELFGEQWRDWHPIVLDEMRKRGLIKIADVDSRWGSPLFVRTGERIEVTEELVTALLHPETQEPEPAQEPITTAPPLPLEASVDFEYAVLQNLVYMREKIDALETQIVKLVQDLGGAG
jgi:hypothetical protein